MPAIATGETAPASIATATGDTAPADISAGSIELPQVESATYELREQLGAGGMGKVVVARDKRLGRLLAIKVAQTADRSLRVRFTREAVLTARLQHPSIIPVHEAGVWGGDEPFYAMKLVAGASLSQLIARGKTLDERLALIPNVIAVVDALAYAHAQRVIHRDLKPDNVIVGEYGETIVIDWGLAKELDVDDPAEDGDTPYRAFDAGQTVRGAAMGTPPYMPPEQATGERVDERADVYGLGAMLYHVLSGVPPYKGANADEVMEKVKAGPPVPLAERQDGIPADLLAIVDKAMARDPLARYANAKQLADDLKRFERGQLVAAHAYSRGELVRRWIARHRGVVAVAAIALIVTGIATTMWVRAEIQDRVDRELRVSELAQADDIDHATAVAQTAAGQYAAATTTLQRELAHLTGKSELADRLAKRRDEHDRVGRIAAFYEHARRANYLTGDEDRGAEAIAELTAALQQIGALDAAGHTTPTRWYEQLFPGELSAEHQRDMQRAAYRLVLDLAFLHFKEGALLVRMQYVLILKSPESAKHFRTCFELLGLTTPLEHALAIRPARVTRIWQTMALFFLSGVGTEQDVAAVGNGPLAPADDKGDDNSDDHALLGAGHFFVWQSLTTPLGVATKKMFPLLFDYDHPLDTAERELRLAIRLDPEPYWPHFMLGWTLRSRGDLGGAELAFDDCVQLESTYIFGYGQRAQVLVEQAQKEPDPKRRDELLARALADSDHTVALASDHPVTYWSRGDLMRSLGKRADAIAAYTRALELESHVLEKFSRQVEIPEIVAYVTADLSPTDGDARALLALLAVAVKDSPKAVDWANQAVALRPQDPHALAARGTAYLQLGKRSEARADLEAAIARAPDYAFAKARLAEANR